MRPVRLPSPLPFSEVGADGHEEFRADAIPVKRVVPIVGSDPLVLRREFCLLAGFGF